MAQEKDEQQVEFADYPPMDETGMVDLWQIEANLAMTPAQRIEKFMRFMELQKAIRQARVKDNGKLPASCSQAS